MRTRSIILALAVALVEPVLGQTSPAPFGLAAAWLPLSPNFTPFLRHSHQRGGQIP